MKLKSNNIQGIRNLFLVYVKLLSMTKKIRFKMLLKSDQYFKIFKLLNRFFQNVFNSSHRFSQLLLRSGIRESDAFRTSE